MSLLKWLAFLRWRGCVVLVTDTLGNTPGGPLLGVSPLGLTLELASGDHEWFGWRSVVSVEIGAFAESAWDRKRKAAQDALRRMESGEMYEGREAPALSIEEIEKLLAEDRA